MSDEEKIKKWKDEYKALQTKLRTADNLLISFKEYDTWEGINCKDLRGKLQFYLEQRAAINPEYPPTNDPILKMDRLRGQARVFIEHYTDLCELHNMVLSGCSHVRPMIGYSSSEKEEHKASLIKMFNITPIKFE